MNIVLESVTTANIGDLLAAGTASFTDYYFLPRSEEEAKYFLSGAETHRQNKVGDDFLAYETTEPGRLVGGGHIACFRDRLSLGYWVAAPFRGQGYGKAILRVIEERGALDYPTAELIEAHIKPQNTGSVALAMSAGYTLLDQVPEIGSIYQKSLR